jgi:hypothetical protein
MRKAARVWRDWLSGAAPRKKTKPATASAANSRCRAIALKFGIGEEPTDSEQLPA